MGTVFKYDCTKCSYTVQSPGELSYGYLAVIRPFICKDCKEVVDVTVGYTGEILPIEMMDEHQKESAHCCPECLGTNITVWYPRYRKCPKCGGYMKRDKNAPPILWD